jgi:repressor LexA
MTEEDEATCKRFFKEKDFVRLQPENSTMEPIILRNVSILGKVIGVYRHLH